MTNETPRMPSRRGEPLVRYRVSHDRIVEAPLQSARASVIAATGKPFRAFRYFEGQKHFPGYHWCARLGVHVGGESQLELSWLEMADQHPETKAILSQPFQLVASVGGRQKRYHPDYLLVDTQSRVSVIEVKPFVMLDDPKVKATLAWARPLIEGHGWRLETWSGLSGVERANLRHITGFRDPRRLDANLVAEVGAAVLDGDTISEVERRLSRRIEPPQTRACLLHLLWWGIFQADLTVPLSTSTRLERV